jgi:hypothetical protein
MTEEMLELRDAGILECWDYGMRELRNSEFLNSRIRNSLIPEF